MTPIPVRLWVDPGCPWAWQGAVWLKRLAEAGVVELDWRIFSLELNSSEMDAPFWEACQRQGESLVALALARREGGNAAFDRLYGELGRRLHDEKQELSPQMVRAGAAAAGMPDLVDRAIDHVRADRRDPAGVPRRSKGERLRRSHPGYRRPAGRIRTGLLTRSEWRRGRAPLGTHPVVGGTAGLLRDEAVAPRHTPRRIGTPDRSPIVTGP